VHNNETVLGVKNEPPLFHGALDAGDSAAFFDIFLASSFFCSQIESRPAHKPVLITAPVKGLKNK
jgi:hypothetical protein